jgi:diguanylate cyclase (GGDEF)-like protein
LVELCLAVLVALLVAAVDPVVMVLALLPVIACQRSLMNAQLVSQTRVDAKSGLLTGAVWRYEAEIEASEARRGHKPLAVMLAEVDEASIGELEPESADQVLRVIAGHLTGKLPPDAQVGRVADAKFAIILPLVAEDKARRAGERIRDHIAGQPVDVEHDGRLLVCRPTLSLGVAGLAGSRRTMAELITAADSALARARSNGGNQVGVAAGGAQIQAD